MRSVSVEPPQAIWYHAAAPTWSNGGGPVPLESLFQSVETLRERIHQHGASLRQNEMLTRYALVDPLLRALGWDTEDPDQVRPEYRVGSSSADYALLKDGKPVMMVEAKKLDTPLRDNVLAQGIQYCLMQGTPYFAVTDGRQWEVYETHKAAPIDEKRIVAFDVADPTPSEAVLNALALWRVNVETGSIASPQRPLAGAPVPATPAVATGGGSSPILPQVPLASEQPPTTATVTPSPPPARPQAGWIPLPQVHPERGANPPISIRFPGGSEVTIKYWIDVTVQATKWLLDNNLLSTSHLPLRYASRHVIAATPAHPDGRAFFEDKTVGHIHLEANYGSRDICRNTLLILERSGQNPDEFSLRF